MIHFTCDSCGQSIDQTEETRYIVRMEVYAAIDEEAPSLIAEEDHLEEIEDILERIDELDDDEDERLYRQVRYDLCPSCRTKFLSNPLGRTTVRSGYSEN